LQGRAKANAWLLAAQSTIGNGIFEVEKDM
jgi:hypothetical protein